MKVIKAKHLGMCFGVRDAIQLAQEEAHKQPLSVLGDLVHNETVLGSLRKHGVSIVQTPAEARTQRLMITAHGAAEKTVAAVKSAGFSVVEATCPLVRVAHQALARLVRDGYHPVVIGKQGHVEVRGLTGDFAECDVVLSKEDLQRVKPRSKFGVIAQTTQPIDRVRELVSHLAKAFPEAEVRFVDTVCHPTKLRQASAIEVACQSDVVVVVGGAHSNNTRELVQTCSRFCGSVHHVQTAADLDPGWFLGASVVGLTAGTSTPDDVIEAVEHWLEQLPIQAPVHPQLEPALAHHMEAA